MRNNMDMRKRITSKVKLFGYFTDRFLFSQLQTKAKEFRMQKKTVKVIFTNDLIGHEILVRGLYEKNQLDSLFEFLRPVSSIFKTTTALDIGANIGNHSLYFSSIFSKVIAFEPSSIIYRLLEINTESTENVKIEKLALGSHESDSILYSNSSNYGSSSIIEDHELFQIQENIKIKPLDDLDFGTNSISLIKIDVEGFEIEVLKGSTKTIKIHQPLIILEQWEKEFVDNTSLSIRFLSDMGYRFVWTDDYSSKSNPLIRKLSKYFWIIRGIRHTYFCNTSLIPAKYHSMIIAVPKQFHEILGVTN